MERPKSSNLIDVTKLLGYEHFEVKKIDGKEQILPIEMDNYICIRPQEFGYETGGENSLFMTYLSKFFQKEKDLLTTKETLNILNDDLEANSSQNLKIDFHPKNSTLRNDYFFLFNDVSKLNQPIKNDKYLTWMYTAKYKKNGK